MAPYRAIPRDYLSDTPLLRAMGFSVSQHGQLGAIPAPTFLSVSPLESMRSGGSIPPPQRGISAILARYHMKTRQMGAAGCPRVNRAKKFMCSPRNTGNINFSLWLSGRLSQGCPDFPKVYVFKIYVPFSCPIIKRQNPGAFLGTTKETKTPLLALFGPTAGGGLTVA